MSITTKDAIKIIKAGGWGYPECDITEANLMAIDALEKQIPKPPIAHYEELDEGDIINCYTCPVCGKTLGWYYGACDCGQKIDWSDWLEE